METRKLSYVEHDDAIIPLVTYLGAHVGPDDEDSANIPELARHLGLDEKEVETVLNGFTGIFRRSEQRSRSKNYGEHYRYTVHLRYARRKYNADRSLYRGAPLSNDDLFGLLNFITTRIEEEHENQRHSKSARNTMIGVWVAGSFSLLAAVLALIGVLIK